MNKKVYGILGFTDCDNVEAIVERMDFSNYEKMIEEIQWTGVPITDELLDTLLFSNGRIFGRLLSRISDTVWHNLLGTLFNCEQDENSRLRKKFHRLFNQLSDVDFKYYNVKHKQTLVYLREGKKIESLSCQDNPCVL